MASSTPSHKSRRRRKDGDQLDVRHATGSLAAKLPSQKIEPSFPLEAFFWPARHTTSQWILIPLVLMIVGLFRWNAGFWGYSGFQSPPMHGDFEAQRHWMEVTTHIPISQWYFHDLEWWGLDYPPLTAYHSWLLGKVGALIEPSWFALYSSRGLDDPQLKVYMRATVIVSEYAVYVPALILCCRQIARLDHVNDWTFVVSLTAILMQPGIILIDHAHFQYNTVMLGFVVACMIGLLHRAFLWTSIFFVAALGFKQMALYYAPAVFAYLLGSCFSPRLNMTQLTAISLVTAASFASLISPMLLGALYDASSGASINANPMPTILQPLRLNVDTSYYPVLVQLGQIIHRVFPFARGLFEDKVANFWCAVHTFHKLNRYPTSLLQRISLGATLMSVLPPSLLVLRYPHRNILLPALATSAWGFFLFSFQVHEKSVLLPLLPMTLMLCCTDGLEPPTRAWITWANILGCWTMYPLLKRDQLRVPYFVLTSLWGWLLGAPSAGFHSLQSANGTLLDRLPGLLQGTFYVFMVVWHLLEAYINPPPSKPDLWVVTNVLIGASGFGICYMWCLWKVWEGMPLRSRNGVGKTKRT